MEELPNETNTVFMDVVRKKMETQDKKISDIQQKMDNPAISPIEIDHIKKSLLEIKTDIQNINFPQKEMQELSANLITGVRLLKHPVENKVQHHHHVPKIIWIACGLFIIVCLLCAGWFTTIKSLEQYKATDTKYRFLKLSDNKSLRQILYITDSLYRVDPAMRDSVVQKEEANQERFELQQRIQKKEKEVKQLKEKAK